MAYRDRTHGYSFGYGLTPWVKRLLIANTVVFLVLLALPASLVGALAFTPVAILERPWGILTYMFVHGDFFHLFFNMLVLFFFGPPLEGMWGGREFLKFYIVAGLGGAAFSFFTPQASVVGSSGAIYGVMLAFAMNWPNMPVHIWGILPVKAKWLVGFLAAVSIFSLLGDRNDGVAHWAHLGGFVAGYLYLKLDDQMTSRVRRLKKFVSRQKLDVSAGGAGAGARPRPPSPRDRRQEDRVLDEVDRVLDKISESGLQSLSEDELRLLDDVSKRYRQN